jgi:hypothetical protein
MTPPSSRIRLRASSFAVGDNKTTYPPVVRYSGVDILDNFVSLLQPTQGAVPQPDCPRLRRHINSPPASSSPSASWWNRCSSGPRTFLYFVGLFGNLAS